ncbi:divergent polysaccharide deacetylase family protein [Simiduia agarivorans]|uniref:divergent polysaccharide deacetylase family protein n=1 Tax=Simiduia agarivorans TaxID=447471 RepID=UPI00138AFE21|nr:divergent polysaccharide deacetylase family protein [Simiduia agarivorans]
MLSLAAGAEPAPADKPLLAIVIDDIGYKRQIAEDLIALPLELTFAVLPRAPHSQALAQRAWLNGREYMLHVPMATQAGNRLDAGGLYDTMDSGTIQQLVNDHLNRFPAASGINNHMGSRLTEMVLPMRAVMETLAPRRLYFLDSKTSRRSVAWQEAKRAGLETVQRDVFLDNEPSAAAIQVQLDKALNIAHEQGFALAIGHPYPDTLAVLRANQAKLNATVKLVPVSQYMRTASHFERDSYHTLDRFWALKAPWRQASTK